MAIDPKHLPEDPKTLQQMVLDLMAQLDREFTERSKIETLLRELLDAKRDRKSEQLSADQLALFAMAWQARQAAAKASESNAGPVMTLSLVGAKQAARKRAAASAAAPQTRAHSGRSAG